MGGRASKESSNEKQDEKWDIEAFSPSKINLFLRIIGKRPDGFHDLGSLFQAISLGDSLKVSKLDQNSVDEFECDMPGVPTDDSNLVLRAAKLFREKTGITNGVRVSLSKKVPAQGGLGGGSANAATMLWAMNKLFDYPATQEELIEWSGDLGSDITFFLSSGTAFCTGRGEILEKVPQLPVQNVYIIKPDVGLSTPLVFKNLNYSELSPEEPREILGRFYANGDTPISDEDDDNQAKPQDGTGIKYINDLEPPAFRLLPVLKEIKEYLNEFDFDAVLMSGSGTSIFAIGEPKSAPEAVFLDEMEDMKEKWNLQVFKARFLNRGENEDQWYELPAGSS